MEQHVPLPDYQAVDDETLQNRASAHLQLMKSRHTVRHFSDRPVPRAVIEQLLQIAGSAPSGANHQPWHFVAISDLAVKQQIRQEAELQEAGFYSGRAGEEWLSALKPLGTDAHKPYLETAP